MARSTTPVAETTETPAPVAEETSGLMNETDVAINAQIASARGVQETARMSQAQCMMARSIRWALLDGTGVQKSLIATAFGVNKSQPSHFKNGVPAGAFLIRAGVDYEVKETSDEYRQEKEDAGEWAPRVLVSWTIKGAREPALVKKFGDLVKKDDENGITEAVIVSWLKDAADFDALAALRKAHIDAEVAKGKEIPNQKAATAALGEVKGIPSAELIAECERVLAMAARIEEAHAE